MLGVFHLHTTEHLDQFTHDLLLDVVLTGDRAWWLKRAEQFEAAWPVTGEYHGKRTPEELRAKWCELTEIANACRARAEVAHIDDLAEDVAAVLREVE